MLTHALNYLNKGFSVIPLKPKGKEPLIEWKDFQTRRPSCAELEEWWTKWPDANIGLVTGSISGFAVLDADGPLGAQFIQSKSISSPVTVISGNGTHLWFKWGDGLRNSQSKLAEKVDMRGAGGYVVAPPSVHPNGSRYRFLRHGVLTVNTLPEVPLLQDSVPTVGMGSVVKSQPDNDWFNGALEDLKNGHVHDTLVSVLGRFRLRNFSEEETYRLLLPHVFENNIPWEPLRRKIAEIWQRYPSGTENVNAIQSFAPGIIGGALKIHSPSDPESIRQYEESKRVESESTDSIKTGYTKLDSFLRGGLRSSRLFTLAARTGVGKTNWLLGTARHLCSSGKRVLFFSTEMRYQEIWDRYRALLGPHESFASHPLQVCDEFTPDLGHLEKAVEEVKPDLFIFDHINHIGEDNQEIGRFFKGLSLIQRRSGCQGIVSAQLNRQADWVDPKSGEHVVPRMSMIKGSGTIEQASSRVLLLSEMRQTDNYTEIIGNLDKNDNGERGLISFALKKQPYRMEEV